MCSEKGVFMAIELHAGNFQEEVLSSSLPVVVKAYASWCGPCVAMAPIYEKVEKQYIERVRFCELNVDQARDLAIQLGVTSIPTLIFVRDGQVIGRETGYLDERSLTDKIDQFFVISDIIFTLT